MKRALAHSEDLRLRVLPHVSVRELEGRSVLLNLESECYLGLDEVGTRMWNVLTSGLTVKTACQQLLLEYEVEPLALERDLDAFVEELIGSGLVELESVDPS